jgi:hypothetical protein
VRRKKSMLKDSKIGGVVSKVTVVTCRGLASVLTTKLPVGSVAKPSPRVNQVEAMEIPIRRVRCIESLTVGNTPARLRDKTMVAEFTVVALATTKVTLDNTKV